MYTSFLGLSREPFRMTPDPALVYMTNSHRETLAGLRYAILAEKGFALVTGDAGTGKTTIISRLRAYLPARVKVFLILNPVLQPDEFLEFLLIHFGVETIPPSKTRRLLILQDLLLQADRHGELPVLIIDEAHKLSPDILEEVRLLGNLETPAKKLLQVVLVGQSELCDLLNRGDLRQLKQRFATRLRLNPLSAQETSEYIAFRWQGSGGVLPPPFTPEALALTARYSKGIPRLINAICDNALILMIAEGKSIVDERVVVPVCSDLDLLDPAPPAGSRPAAAHPAATSEAVDAVPAVPIEMPPVSIAAGTAERQAAPFQTLQRYADAASRKSLLTRVVARFGWAS